MISDRQLTAPRSLGNRSSTMELHSWTNHPQIWNYPLVIVILWCFYGNSQNLCGIYYWELLEYMMEYTLVICYSLLLKMAVEIVSFPLKKMWFSIVMLVYQRVSIIVRCQSYSLRPIKIVTFHRSGNMSLSESRASQMNSNGLCSFWLY